MGEWIYKLTFNNSINMYVTWRKTDMSLVKISHTHRKISIIIVMKQEIYITVRMKEGYLKGGQ